MARNDLHASYHDKHKKRSEISGKSLAHQALLNRTSRKTGVLFFYFQLTGSSRLALLGKKSPSEIGKMIMTRVHLSPPRTSLGATAKSDGARRAIDSHARVGGCDLYSRRAQKARWIIAEVPPHGIAEREGQRGERETERERERARWRLPSIAEVISECIL